ncbi:MAG: hypothetical protein ACI9XK_002588 [Granulosicoccus sp.]|jgi:hypothetical protein
MTLIPVFRVSSAKKGPLHKSDASGILCVQCNLKRVI